MNPSVAGGPFSFIRGEILRQHNNTCTYAGVFDNALPTFVGDLSGHTCNNCNNTIVFDNVVEVSCPLKGDSTGDTHDNKSRSVSPAVTLAVPVEQAHKNISLGTVFFHN